MASMRLCEGAQELYSQEKVSGWRISSKSSPNISYKVPVIIDFSLNQRSSVGQHGGKWSKL